MIFSMIGVEIKLEIILETLRYHRNLKPHLKSEKRTQVETFGTRKAFLINFPLQVNINESTLAQHKQEVKTETINQLKENRIFQAALQPRIKQSKISSSAYSSAEEEKRKEIPNNGERN
ncbi:CLUMA_CG019206, isoform A [Clunio marinus]|uniref:CLUMA_CG019206, isoform A n=1 Tax=Clunio marinus TaxID=568069 RepID=A0A1J1J1D2_9DIPT|nr:CLUMA_CG019206, isoform A [Clunio marinus]